MRVAALQMQSTPDPEHNLAQARALLEHAVAQGAEMIALPELFYCLSHSARELVRHAVHARHPLLGTLREWAIEQELWIHVGSLAWREPGVRKLLNQSLLLSPDGKVHARYAKRHLFRGLPDRDADETRLFAAGTRRGFATLESHHSGERWRLETQICFDLRFPEVDPDARRPELLVVPSAFWAQTGQAHWDSLTRARAIERQCYVVAPAQVGLAYPGRESHGHTRIVDPWGRVIAERPKGVGVVSAEISLERVAQVRQMIALSTRPTARVSRR